MILSCRNTLLGQVAYVQVGLLQTPNVVSFPKADLFETRDRSLHRPVLHREMLLGLRGSWPRAKGKINVLTNYFHFPLSKNEILPAVKVPLRSILFRACPVSSYVSSFLSISLLLSLSFSICAHLTRITPQIESPY